MSLLAGWVVWRSHCPSVATPQTANIPRIGMMQGGHPTVGGSLVEVFKERLRELGYVEGSEYALEVRWAEGRLERMPEFAVELVRLNVNLLVAVNSAAAIAAKKATRTIPIVMFAGDPVGLGLVDSLARPGGNVTGLSFYNLDISRKRLELLSELVPGLERIGVLRNPMLAIHASFWTETEAAARQLGVAVEPLEVRGPEDLDVAFAVAQRANAQALIAFDDPLTLAHRRRIAELAAKSRLPTMYGFREFPDDGGLMSYGSSLVFLYRSAATLVGKILKGAKPADLPVQQPTTLELVINLKAARDLGLTIPPTLLARADEVIE